MIREALTHDTHGELKPKLRGLVHAWSAVPVGIASLLLVILTPDTSTRFAVAIYGLSVTGMLTASACYHRLHVSEKTRNYLRRLDHSMIGVAVAGTYTPVIVLVLRGNLRTTLLVFLWVGALGAMLVSIFWPHAPNWLRALIYLALGWGGVVAMPYIYTNGGVACFVMVLVGALFYSLGATVYATKKPNPYPSVFGFHEVFHTLVVLAALSHFAAVALAVHQNA